MSGTAVDAGTAAPDAAAVAAAAAAAAASGSGEPAKPVVPAKTEDAPKTGTALSSGEVDGVKPKGEEAPKTEAKSEAPASYDIKAPEGVELDAAVVESFVTEVAKAHNLTNAQAQAVVDYGLKREAAKTKADAEQVAKDEKDALDLLRKDPELGGANYEQTLKLASKAFMKFATPEEREFIDATRLGNRVPMIRLFHRIALAFREDAEGGSLAGSASSSVKTEEDMHREMYPSMFKQE